MIPWQTWAFLAGAAIVTLALIAYLVREGEKEREAEIERAKQARRRNLAFKMNRETKWSD